MVEKINEVWNVPKIHTPEVYEEWRQKVPYLPELHLEEWDDRLPIVWKKYRGMYPEYVNRFVEVLGKRKKKLKIRYAPTMEEHEGWNCTASVGEMVFFGGEDTHEGKPVLVFYFVFSKWRMCGGWNSSTAREYQDWLVYRELVNIETGEVFHIRVR